MEVFMHVGNVKKVSLKNGLNIEGSLKLGVLEWQVSLYLVKLPSDYSAVTVVSV